VDTDEVLVPSRAWWSSKSSSALKPEIPDDLVWETRQSGLAAIVNWPVLQLYSVSCHLGPYLALLQPSPDLSLHLASLHHWPKIHASALS
jgi:hypothetical protein